MKNIKRWLAALLIVVLTLNTWTGSAWAEKDTENVETMQIEENQGAESGQAESEDETVLDSQSDDQNLDSETEESREIAASENEEVLSETTGESESETSVSDEVVENLEVHGMQSVTTSFNSMCEDVFGSSYELICNSSDYAEVYVGNNSGSEQTGELGSETKPYGSLTDAYTALASANKKGAVVHLMESYSTVNENLNIWPESAVPMIIVSDSYEKAMLTMGGTKWNFQANIGFYNVQIQLMYADNVNAAMYANGHTVVFGGYGENNFAFVNEGESKNYPTLFGASSSDTGTSVEHSSVASTCLKVYGGTWSQIFGGGEYYSDVSGQAYVSISGYITSSDDAGAVSFSKNNTFYMEGSSYIYGGGAGNLQSVSSEEDYSHCGSTEVDVEYVTLDKSITPNGGYVATTAVLYLKNSTVNGTVHVYSEGQPAEEVELNVENSKIQKIGSYGLNNGDVTQKYRIGREGGLKKLTFNLYKTNVTEYFKVRAGLLAEKQYNDIQETNVKICDSELQNFSLGEGATTNQTNDKQNEVLNLWVENSNIKNKMNSFYGFCKIGQLTLVGMGTEANPFAIEKSTFGSYSHNREIKTLVLKNSSVSFADTYTVETVELENSSIQMKNQELNVTDVNTSGTDDVLYTSNSTDGTTSNSAASVYDTIFTNSSSRVTENMIFVFDFSEVAASEWDKISQLEDHVMLRHTYNNSKYENVDIMDYVSSESQNNEGDAPTYSREVPKQTDTFKISKDSDGIVQFEITNGDSNTTYGPKDPMKFNLKITPDTSVTNTQYDEREYAVILTLRKKNDVADTADSTADIAFPEGTTFTFKGEQLNAGKDNKYVIVPVKTVGSHEVEIESKLYGFDPDEYQLAAKLYSTSEEGYFNSIPVAANEGDKSTAYFTIQADPVYALKVEEKRADATETETRHEKNHFIQPGENFDFAVTATGGNDSDSVDVQLYRYANNVYQTIALQDVFETEADLHTGNAMSWQPVVNSGTAKGTYRLAFTYHDKVEYWDFMVQ